MRTAGSRRDITEQAIREAAVDMISRLGFHAASLRMLAKQVGIQAGSLYNYIHSKEGFLTALIGSTLTGMLDTLQVRLDGVDDPTICLMEFIWLHLELHTDTRKQKEIRIGNLELRNLSPDCYKQVTGLRDAYSQYLTAILTAGSKKGKFKVHDARLSTFAVLAMATGVSYWFTEGGRLSRVAVMREHTRIALQMVSADVAEKDLTRFFKKAEARMMHSDISGGDASPPLKRSRKPAAKRPAKSPLPVSA